jgi:hypothetical protein
MTDQSGCLHNKLGTVEKVCPREGGGRQPRSLPSPERLRAGRSVRCRAHVLRVRSASPQRSRPPGRGKSYCGLVRGMARLGVHRLGG